MRKKLKIAYFLDNFYPQINGVVTSSINTVFEFSKRGHSVYGVVSANKKQLDYPTDYFPFPLYIQKGFNAFFYPDFTFTYPFSQKVFQIMKEYSPDIIHFHAPLTVGYQAIRVAKELGIPVVGTFHTFFAEPEYLSVIGMKHAGFLRNFGWWYSNQFFNRCDAVVSPGKATAEFLIKEKLKTYLEIISNGVEIEKYSNIKQGLLDLSESSFPFKIKENEDWIIFIGRISEEKCLDALISSFELVSAKKESARLLIVGDGPSLKKNQKHVLKKNLSDKIHFTGKIPNKILLESGILGKMKLFVTPSTSENQPMTILEAMMFGLPIIGANAKGIPELIEGNGFVISPHNCSEMAEKILLLLNDKNLHKQFSEKSLELSQKYDIRKTSDQMENLYYKLIDEFNNFKN